MISKVFWKLLISILLLCCIMTLQPSVVVTGTPCYPSSKGLLTHTNRHLLPVTIILPIAGETKATLPQMHRIALNPSQYQITSIPGAEETKDDTETLYSVQSSTKTDGSKTISELRECSETTKSHTTIVKHANGTISEKQLLYSLVQAEAGNQDVDGCRLVADVVLNRIASNKFPSDMEGVIYSPGQFSVVRNGALKKSQGEISAKVVQAVDMELSGTKLNNDVLYFNNKPNGGWKYGDHYFK